MEFARKAVTNSRQRGTAGAGNIFTGILAEAEKSESTVSDLVLEREARSLIVAGTDTTALSLTFLVWSVLSRPELHRDLLSELREAESNCVADECGGAGFSDEQLEQLPLLTAVD
ncbi:Cytochrome P450 [Macrophomina phaseolina MS6]|uniref:Cytochrome P450 n=1 Tax=Macrophomina phaseolina (strain MS6) TaxID=1126212 RepID=K2S8Z4_MACPH|nr:Cytochrome P450 [Macrophomina phaseolina MS6]